MIDWEEALENPELMIKHKEDLKNIELFREPWHKIFSRYPYLYREFSDRFNEMGGVGAAYVLVNDPSLVLDLKNRLHNIYSETAGWVAGWRPELSLCLKYKDNPDKAEAAYYIGYPHELDNLNKEERREMSKRIIEILREEKT